MWGRPCWRGDYTISSVALQHVFITTTPTRCFFYLFCDLFGVFVLSFPKGSRSLAEAPLQDNLSPVTSPVPGGSLYSKQAVG